MKQLINALKTVRKVELLAIAAVVCIMAILCMGNSGGNGYTSTEEEIRMARILSQIEGIRKASVMISYGPDQEKNGVLVAANGTDDVRTMLMLQRAVKTLTGLELDQIEIVISKR